MGWQFPGKLHSWQQQERQALANPGWRSMLRVAVPLQLVLVGLEGARRLQERAQNLEEKQQQAIDLLYWLAGEQRRTALDWAHWDDSLAYVEGRNPAFPSTDMDTSALLSAGAVMAIWGPTGQPLTIRGGNPEDQAGLSALRSCLDGVESKRRSSRADHLSVLCSGGEQLYVGSLESISDNTSTIRSDASLAYVVPLLTSESNKPLAASMRRLRSELLLAESAGSTATARVLAPPLWTTGGKMVRVLPAATLRNTLPALQPLAGLVSACTAIVLGLRMNWMLAIRGQRLRARRSELVQGRRIRKMRREIGHLLAQGQGRGRSDQVGAFARLIHQQSAQGGEGGSPGISAAKGLGAEEDLVQGIENLLANARDLVLNDSLTGLPNRSHFLQQLNRESEHCRSQGETLALLFINIDRFKRINETYGHNVGDLVLQHVARDLQRLIQPDDFLARFSGDEFGLILNIRNLRNLSESAVRDLAHQRAVMLLDKFNNSITIDLEKLNISLSIGIALSDLQGSSPEELIRRSEQAMVIAKQRRSSAVSVFDINCDAYQLADYRLFNALESDLNEASEHFQIMFQPIVGLDGSMFEVEALARWLNPQFPGIPPDMFINLAERYRLIERLGKIVIDKSLLGFRQLRQQLPDGSSLQLAINISPSQLLHEGFAPWLLEQLRLREIPPSAITVEVTESAVIESTEDFTINLASLRQAGVRLALDDFGTGFSSLKLLMALRPDELKIDQSFVSATLNDGLALQIVLLLQQLSETMGLTLVAEGVEDEQIRDRLVQAGVRCFQGYLYTRPASPADLIASQRQTAPRWQEQHP
jgi:diguanylate cyclase (GGDEF)-like protein